MASKWVRAVKGMYEVRSMHNGLLNECQGGSGDSAGGLDYHHHHHHHLVRMSPP
jgi:hypothetical protein